MMWMVGRPLQRNGLDVQSCRQAWAVRSKSRDEAEFVPVLGVLGQPKSYPLWYNTRQTRGIPEC